MDYTGISAAAVKMIKEFGYRVTLEIEAPVQGNGWVKPHSPTLVSVDAVNVPVSGDVSVTIASPDQLQRVTSVWLIAGGDDYTRATHIRAGTSRYAVKFCNMISPAGTSIVCAIGGAIS